MPKKKKLKLDSLSVTSFITSEESRKVKGLGGSTGDPYQLCVKTCNIPFTGDTCETCGQPACSDSCYDSCGGTCELNCTDDCGPQVKTLPGVLCLPIRTR